jgi:phosphorylcholine metabolism protein LicD
MNTLILRKVMNRRLKNKILFIEDTDITTEIIDKYFNENLGFGKYKQTAIDLLQITIKILNEFEIPYCLISGTLLGYVRHNDFIPWDDDMDLLVDNSINTKYEDIKKKYKEQLNFIIIGNNVVKMCFKNKEFPIENCNLSKLLDPPDTYNWPFIDLFTYIDINQTNEILKTKETIKFFGKIWLKKEFFPAKISKFLDIDVAIPKNPQYFLDLNFSKECLTMLVSNRYIHKDEKKVDENAVKISLKKYQELLTLALHNIHASTK